MFEKYNTFEETSSIPDTTPLPSTKKILITGGTGFIGQRLVQVLLTLNYELTVLTRNINSAEKVLSSKVKLITELSEIPDHCEFNIIINLAGESLAGGRWTTKRKEQFIESRLSVTSQLCNLIERLKVKPELLISGSAIGYYGPNKNNILDEKGDTTDCFPHQLCKQWEEQALKAKSSQTRVCLLRIGIVLGNNGGSLEELLLPFKLGFSMQISNGDQWMSWIHRDDLVAIMLHLIISPEISGPINGTAPQPVTNKEFANILSLYVKTYIRLRIPAKFLSIMVGELADELLITGQHVIPAKIEKNGFKFTYPTLSNALEELIG